MGHVELSTEINAPPQAIWDLTTDFRRIPELAPETAVEVSYVSKGEIGVGTVFREKDKLGPMKFGPSGVSRILILPAGMSTLGARDQWGWW